MKQLGNFLFYRYEFKFFKKYGNQKFLTGFTLIESIIGIALMLVVFLGIFGVAQLSFRIVAQSKARVTASAIANQRIEFIRNLSYGDVGTSGGIPSGIIPQTEIITKNNIQYTVRTFVSYIDDIFDGLAPDDTLPNDYKRVKVELSWQTGLDGEIFLITDISSKGLETSVGGGNLLITVFDAAGAAVQGASIHIVNVETVPPIDVYYQTNSEGRYLVAGAPASVAGYQVIISRSGYSSDRTYGMEEIVNPENPHITVIEGKLTQASFSIDRLGDFSVNTFSQFGVESFLDSFVDQDKISEMIDIDVLAGQAMLATSSEGYFPLGYIVSQEISPVDLRNWDEFSWNDNEPLNTEIRQQVFYATSTNWYLVSNNDLPGNSVGFGMSPVDLSSLAINDYPKLKLKGNFLTSNASTTPELYDWQASWRTADPAPIGGVQFYLRGNKIIGYDIDDLPVYKYSQNHTSNGSGHLDLSDMEWDSYDFIVDRVLTGLDIADIIPSPQPVGLFPGTSQPVDLFLSAQNSLLVKLKDIESGDPVFSASIRIYNAGFGYDATQYTDQKGETVFIPIERNGIYNYEIQVAGYDDSVGNVSVSGGSSKIIYLTPGQI